ncbi:hypothetical protein ACOYR1_03295 [Thalassotalea piscium]
MNICKPLIISMALSISTVSAAQAKYEEMNKQLAIMNNIIKASVVNSSNSNSIKLSGVNSTYLEGQGIVFTLTSNSRFSGWGDYNFNFVLPELPELPDVSFTSRDVSDYDLNDDEEKIASFTNNALEMAAQGYERAMETMESKQEGYRELRDSQRELKYRLRDIERETRDIEYQLRFAEKEGKEKLMKKKNSLAEKRAALENKAKALNEQTIALKKEQEQEKQKQLKIRSTYYTQLAESITDTLCLYGNGLKALPKDESVSLILKSAGNKVNNRYKDKIYVFSKQAISSCSADKITSTQLLAKAVHYQF